MSSAASTSAGGGGGGDRVNRAGGGGVASGAGAAAGAARSAVEGGLARLGSPAALVGLTVLGAALVSVFWRWFVVQGKLSWWKKEDWGHAFLIPLISAWLLWQKRAWVSSARARVFWPGLLVVLTGIAAYVFLVVLYPNHMGQGFSLVLVVYGLALLLAGPEVTRRSFLPIAYLAFGVTLSEKIMIELTFQLQLLASAGSEVMLKVIGAAGGFDISRDGNTLTLHSGGESHPLNVAEACSGMRMVVAFYALSVATGLFACRAWWQRIVTVLLAGPVALLMNMVRVTVLGLLTLVDPGLAEGNAHTLIGTILLVPSLGLFLGIVWALNKVVQDETGPAKAVPAKAGVTKAGVAKAGVSRAGAGRAGNAPGAASKGGRP